MVQLSSPAHRFGARLWPLALLFGLLPAVMAVAQPTAASHSVDSETNTPPQGEVRDGIGRGFFRTLSVDLNTTVGRGPYGLAAGDVDGDGDLDVVTANNGFGSGNTLSIRLNDGTGHFSGTAKVSVGSQPQNVALGDLDGDGDLDLLSANRGSNTVSVRLNDGTGSFRAPAKNANPWVLFQPQSVALGDVDGDGDLDFVAGNGAGTRMVSVRLNDGTGSFSAPINNPEPLVGSIPCSVALKDVDGDGDRDLLSANFGTGTVSVRLNDGTGNFRGGTDINVGAEPVSLTTGDIDGDGDQDLLTANSAGAYSVSVRLNDGRGNFSAPATAEFALETRPVGLALGDVDGDGDLDFLTANYGDGRGNTVSLRLNDGSGNFSAPPINPDPVVGASPFGVVLADVDSDGDLDFLATNAGSNTVSVGLNQPLGPTPPISPAVVRETR